MFVGFNPWLYSNGGRLLDFKTGEIFINDAKGVEALQFYAELVTKYKVVPPEAMTWEFDEIVAGGQSDRYAMVQMFAPYGTLINDPKISKTGGKWAWTTVQGPHSKDEGRTWIDGHSLGVPKYTRNKEWALEFIADGVQPGVAEARDDSRQRATAAFRAGGSRDGRNASAGRRSPPRRSRPGFRRRRIRCGTRWRSSCGRRCRKPCSDRRLRSRRWTIWRATGSAACGARGSGDDQTPASSSGIRRVRRTASDCPGAEQTGQAGVRRRQRAVALVPGRGSGAGVREGDRHQDRFHPAADRCAERTAEIRTEFRLQRHRHRPVDVAADRLALPASGRPREAARAVRQASTPISAGTISCRRSARWRSGTASCPASRIA